LSARIVAPKIVIRQRRRGPVQHRDIRCGVKSRNQQGHAERDGERYRNDNRVLFRERQHVQLYLKIGVTRRAA
jgi:hypothetical protein